MEHNNNITEKIFEMPNSLGISHSAYNSLAQLQYNVLHCNERKVILDFRHTNYIDAIHMAFIGGLDSLCRIRNKRLIYRINNQSRLYTYIQRSGLYEYLVKPEHSYINNNAIPFSEIHMDEESIIDYINRILDLAPINLSPSAEGYLFKNIYEIFSNSSDHSEAISGVYACGHWMPQKKHLVFSVYDTGIGIPSLIKRKINPCLSSKEALKWALETGNSTKQLTDGTPRGIGLSDLLEFVGINEGALYIQSNDVYYSYENGSEQFITLSKPIIGTIIGIKIVSDYEHIYNH